MEAIRLLLEDREFDRLVHTGLREGGDLTFALKRCATEAAQPGVVIAFTVELPGGARRGAQAVTSLRALELAVRALRAAADQSTPNGQGGHP